MAHFAKIGNDNLVLQVLTIEDKHILNADGVEDESVGQQYLALHHNWPAEMWIKTSYSTNGNQHKNGGTPFRGNYACPGGTWDPTNQIFWHPKPYNSWIKDIPTALWKAPIDEPTAIDTSAENYDWPDDPRWDEDLYQSDNTKGWWAWKLYEKEPFVAHEDRDPIRYIWDGSAWVNGEAILG
jgi:hypothetical protein